MRKRIAFIIVTACALLIAGCGASNSADYPAAIMVNDTVYLVEGGIAVLYNNEWYLGTPFSNVADEDTDVLSPLEGVKYAF